jgi:hypothetical protein
MQNNLLSLLEVYPDLVQSITKLIKNRNDKIVLESINYLVKSLRFLYDTLRINPNFCQKTNNIFSFSELSINQNRLKSITEFSNELSTSTYSPLSNLSPPLKKEGNLNGFIIKLSSLDKIRKKSCDSSDKSSGKKGNEFEIKKLLESKFENEKKILSNNNKIIFS